MAVLGSVVPIARCLQLAVQHLEAPLAHNGDCMHIRVDRQMGHCWLFRRVALLLTMGIACTFESTARCLIVGCSILWRSSLMIGVACTLASTGTVRVWVVPLFLLLVPVWSLMRELSQ